MRYVLIATAVLLCLGTGYRLGCYRTFQRFRPVRYEVRNRQGNCEAWVFSSPPLYTMSVTTNPYWDGGKWVLRKEEK